MHRLFFFIILISVGIGCFLTSLAYADTDIDKYIQMLGDKNASERSKAAQALLENIDAAFQNLAGIAMNPAKSMKLRQEAIKILGKAKSKQAVAVLQNVLNGENASMLKITSLYALANYISDKDAVTTIIAEIASTNPEIAVTALQIVEENLIQEAFKPIMNLIYNNSCDKCTSEAPVLAALASAGCAIIEKGNIDAKTIKNFAYNLRTVIKKYNKNTMLRSALVFSLARTKDSQTIDLLVSIIKDLEFIAKFDIEERKLREDFDAANKDSEATPEETKVKHQELEAKITKLSDAAIKKQMKLNYMASEVLANNFSSAGFDKISALLTEGKDLKILDTFNHYVIYCSADILTKIVNEFAKPKPVEPGKDAKPEETEKYDSESQKYLEYTNNLKFAAQSHIRTKQESVKILIPFAQYYSNLLVAENLLDVLSNIALPIIVEEMSKVFDAESKATDEIKILVLESFLNITKSNRSQNYENENYYAEVVASMLANPISAALKDDSETINAKALEVINSKPYAFDAKKTEILKLITNIVETSKSEEIIALSCEALVNLNQNGAVTIMLKVLSSVQEPKARANLLEAFTRAPFASPREKTVFINYVKDDLLNIEKPMELRKAAANALRATQDSEAVNVILEALVATKDKDDYAFKGVLVDQLDQLRENSTTAVEQIITELKDANYKYFTSKMEKPDDPAAQIQRNYLTTYIRTCISALRNIGDNRAVSILGDLLTFEGGRINIEVLDALKAFIDQKDTAGDVIMLLIQSAVDSFEKGTLKLDAEFIEKGLRIIHGAKSYIRGIVRIKVRNGIKILIESVNENILSEVINLIADVKDKSPATKRKLAQLQKKYPGLEIVISNTLEILNSR